MTKPTVVRAPDATRERILNAAFAEFYRKGFQSGSLNQIVEAAGTTKGALFHHFDGKQQLAYAVVDELIEPLLLARWLDPLVESTDPIGSLQASFRRFGNEDTDSRSGIQGCPLNNLAQEMSPLDDGFRLRIDRLYTLWRNGIATALTRGIEAGTVRKDVVPKTIASFVVAGQMGIWGTGKSSQSKTVMMQATDVLCDFLDTLRN
ncbi:MAG TPA: TetR/AcrR family transcriptional regulator [Gemmatimonadaceae bacterium]|jgi:AcrR family transcriptional regulator